MWKRKKKDEVPAVDVSPEIADPVSSSGTVTAFLGVGANADRRRVEVLLDSIARVSASPDLDNLLDHVVDSAIEATQAERGILVLQEDGQSKPVVRVARGGGIALEDVRYSTSVVAKVMDSGVPMRSTVRAGEAPADLGASLVNLKLRAVMCVPVELGGEAQSRGAKGVLYVDSRAATREFADADLGLFHALGQHIGIALQNRKLAMQAVDQARLQRSLEIAEEIQQGLMPAASPNIPGFVAHGWFRAAEHAAGDFFDFVPTQSGSLAAVVGDVSGHGIGPALITATAQAGLRAYLRLISDPEQVLSLLNQDLSERMEVGMFLTLALAIVGRDGQVQIVNAGHPPPFVWRNETKSIECLQAHELAIGLSEQHQYSVTSSFQLNPGDILLVYSDGLVEARHPTRPDRLFGEDGLRAVLSDVGYRGGSPEDLVSELSRNVLEFCEGSREDDMTVVAIGLPA
ncbi:MAG: SpoIIE family protein phosphatase [Planctomycetes bacterium]|nr:SpoIIE family protein phosphatase [Planctomycetota bacterium]